MSRATDGSRREFLEALGIAAGAAVVTPVLQACGGGADAGPTTPEGERVTSAPAGTLESGTPADPLAVPAMRPADWDAIAFNRDRGNAGAVPESYRASINGPEGERGHLGKHIPYVPEVDSSMVPEGFMPLMFGDGSREFARHPANQPAQDGSGGHWYDWIKVRKAVEGEVEELETRFSSWPELDTEGDRGRYAVLGGGAITDDAGRNTIYLVPLPPGVGSGDLVRVIGHCSLHGEYVDFLAVPGRVASASA